MGYYDQQFDHMKARNAAQANAEVDALRRSRIPTPTEKPTQYNRPFDHMKAQQARANLKPKLARPAPKPAPVAAPKPAGPSTLSKVGKVAGKALTRPYSNRAIAGGAARLAGRGVMGAIGVPGMAAYAGYKIGDSLKDTETAQAMQRPVTDAMASMTGLDDLQGRMLSDDPAVSGQAIAEYRAANPQIKRPGQPSAAPVASPPAPGAVADPAARQAGSAPIQQPYVHAQGQSNPDVLSRPTMGKDGQPVIDPSTGQPVPEFTDSYAVTGMNRPAQSPQDLAAEQARVADARQNYTDNTTGSDGRRFYGGPETEQLRAAQNAAVARGDTATVGQQLADEGLTPEQRAAYKADPAGAYQVDAQANSSAAKAQLDAFKYQQAQQRNTATDARLNRTAAMKEAGTVLAPLKDASPEAYTQLLTMADQQFDPASGESMSSVVARLLSSFELDGGIPQIDENGNLVQKKQQVAAGEAPDVDVHI